MSAAEQERRELAEYASQRLWDDGSVLHTAMLMSDTTGGHIAANDPQTVIADLDLLDAYREANKRLDRFMICPTSDTLNALGLAQARVAELEAARP